MGHLHESGRRVDLAARADRREKIALAEILEDFVEVHGHFAEPDDVGAEISATFTTAGFEGEVAVPVADAFAENAAGLEQFAVEVDQLGRATALVEIIDILRHKRDDTVELPLEPGNGVMGGIGQGVGQLAAAIVVETLHEFGICRETLGRGDFLDAVSFPKSARSTKGRESRLRRDAGSGEEKEVGGTGHDRQGTPLAAVSRVHCAMTIAFQGMLADLRSPMNRWTTLTLTILAVARANAAPIERIWLSHEEATPSTLTINWETDEPTRSVVAYGSGSDLGEEVRGEALAKRHHVRIPFEPGDEMIHYRVGEGETLSEVHQVKRPPTDLLRLAVIADWGFAPGRDLSAIVKDEPHLLLTGGDNVPSLYQPGKEGTKAFGALIDQHPEIFRRIPFLPILGNHDREITPRGPKPPDHPVYDIEATAYREFFTLPGDEWRWVFGMPAFDLSLIALDLNHIQDFGTTWQTCHAWQAESEPFRWYAETMAARREGFVLTLMNEKQTQLAGLTKGAWHEHFRKGTALITGFGYFAERAELAGGLPYFNTCLKGDGDLYMDPQSRFHARVDNYLLITLKAGAPTMRVEIKSLAGEVLDTSEISRRPVP
jgi:hypothetical protein